MSQAQPATENLSDQIARLQRTLADNDVLMPGTILDLVEFNRRFLAHLQRFAADYEAARDLSPSPAALLLAAAAAVRFYFRLEAPAAPLSAPAIAMRCGVTGRTQGAVVLDLDRFRRPPRGGDVA